MKKLLLTFVILATLQTSLEAQKFITREGYARFFSTTPVEDIEAVNVQMSSIFDASTGKIVFQVPIKGFKFEKALMQEHFNENYMESDKIPNASFKGEVVSFPGISEVTESGIQVEVKGDLTIHGVTQAVTEQFTLSMKGGKLFLEGTFKVSPEDYKINIPSAVSDKIAESLDVTLKVEYSEK